jgi:hypothetical protein
LEVEAGNSLNEKLADLCGSEMEVAVMEALGSVPTERRIGGV